MWRQGDLLFIPVTEIKGKKQKNNVIAYGEMTGHSHTLADGEVFSHKGDKFLVLDKASEIVHEEHKPIALEPGKYQVLKQREYKPAKKRAVAVVD